MVKSNMNVMLPGLVQANMVLMVEDKNKAGRPRAPKANWLLDSKKLCAGAREVRPHPHPLSLPLPLSLSLSLSRSLSLPVPVPLPVPQQEALRGSARGPLHCYTYQKTITTCMLLV